MIDAPVRVLAIVDDGGTGEGWPPIPSGGAIDLLAFTGDWTRIESWRAQLEAGGNRVTLLPSAAWLEQETAALRSALPAWADGVGAHVVDGRSVRERLATADRATSAFWYGSIAERNAFKCREFLWAAQARVLDRCLAEATYARAIVRCGEAPLQQTLAAVCAARGVPAGAAQADERWASRGAAREGLVALAKFVARGLLARGLTLRRVAPAADADPLLAVTYYPFLDRAQAAEGTFVNRYFAPVQRLLEEEGRPIWWVAIFVLIDGWGFRGAVSLTRRLSRAGQRIALLDAYFTPGAAWRVLREWLRIRRAALAILPSLDGVLTGPLLPAGAQALGRRFWVRSYAGVDLVRGLYYHEVFRRLMPDTRPARTCLYAAEFQSWEHALNAHARARTRPLETVGFQHTSVSRNYTFYFHPQADRTGPMPLALPSTLALSGRLPAQLLAECAYPATRQVEAIRQLHLEGVVERPAHAPGRVPRLLVAGSIDRQESRAMLSLVAGAFPRAEGLRVVLRGHPSQPLEPLCAELGVSIEAAGYETSAGPADEALRASELVLVGSSSLSIEALAYGCEVVAPCFASFLPLTPLAGFEDMYERVYGPGDLRAVVERYRASGPSRPDAAKRAFVREYWNLDGSLAGWRAVLEARDQEKRDERCRT